MTNIHILDLLMYFPCVSLLWKLMDFLSDSQATEELGAFVGLFIMGLFTVFYIIIFGVCDYNWIDILKGTQHIFTNTQITW